MSTQSENNAVSVCYVVALTCEAQGLVEFYKLKKISSKPFHYYQRDHIHLIISGSGKARMAAAVGWLGSQRGGDNCVWLNVGTAGHQTLELGTIARVHGVEGASDKLFYPPLLATWKGESSNILCVDKPSDDYLDNTLVDMESGAFFTAARLFAEDERMQSLKVVSDNAKSDYRELTPKKVTELMQPHCEAIANYANLLAEIFAVGQQFDSFIPEHLHCTQSQKHQFDNLIRRLSTVGELRGKESLDFEQYKTMRELIHALRTKLEDQVPACESING